MDEGKEIQSIVSQRSLEGQDAKKLTQAREKIGRKKRWAWQTPDDGSPPEIYNWTLYMSVFVFGILGSARGYDEGNSKY
ncbi:uncharacterized protein PRCAT00006332001 [Priceomyces carsonii]|uniref:uncharacterized protein n=1 Tax=Priceomyces carsonii TaxID=28549 RepID=UPI002ED93BA6|nr:unnamed protein product [Priceomyces carsonii]